MKIAVYPGSFNPWHEGHDDILAKALEVFDEIIIAQGVNPDKKISERTRLPVAIKVKYGNRVTFAAFTTLLSEFVKSTEAIAIVRGLRNSQDLEFERTQQYWNEDLGIKMPTVCFITDRKLTHISSTAIRTVKQFKGDT